jgi:multicomponent Na+:H+ antiporter subunit E
MTRRSWFRRGLSLLTLLAIFPRELLLSSVAVAKAAFARDPQVAPAIIAVPIALKTDLGIAALANLVSLTPGTTSLHVNDARSILYVHCLDAPSAERVVADIKNTFERRIQEIEG